MSEAEYLDDSLDAREAIWDIQDILCGRSARSMLNGGRLYKENTITDTDKAFIIAKEKVAHKKAKAAKVGDEITCAFCGTKFTKKTYNQAFDKSKCKDRYWNTVDEKRAERAIKFSEKIES